jgi:hypothetical protein
VESTTAGIVVIIFFVLYQQLENRVLQPLIFARTVKVNPLTVLIAILIAVELAGIIQIIARDIWDTRRGRLKTEQTVGEDETPVDSTSPRPQPQPAGAPVKGDVAAIALHDRDQRTQQS